MPRINDDQYNDPTLYVFRTVAAMRLGQYPGGTNNNGLAVLLGNAAAFDQAIKVYSFDSASSTADNGTTIIRPTAIDSAAAGRWRSP